MQSTANSGTSAGLARGALSWERTLTTVGLGLGNDAGVVRRSRDADGVADPSRGVSWLRLAPCARCSGHHRLLAESDGVLRGHCLGCGASLDTPLATERIALTAERRAQLRVPPAATPVVPQPASSGRGVGRW
jgi:hypothetical protein